MKERKNVSEREDLKNKNILTMFILKGKKIPQILLSSIAFLLPLSLLLSQTRSIKAFWFKTRIWSQTTWVHILTPQFTTV